MQQKRKTRGCFAGGERGLTRVARWSDWYLVMWVGTEAGKWLWGRRRGRRGDRVSALNRCCQGIMLASPRRQPVDLPVLQALLPSKNTQATVDEETCVTLYTHICADTRGGRGWFGGRVEHTKREQKKQKTKKVALPSNILQVGDSTCKYLQDCGS